MVKLANEMLPTAPILATCFALTFSILTHVHDWSREHLTFMIGT